MKMKLATAKKAVPAKSVDQGLLQPGTAFAISLATQAAEPAGERKLNEIIPRFDVKRSESRASTTQAVIPETLSRLPDILIDQMGQLQKIMVRETEFLKKRDIDGIKEMARQKFRIAESFKTNYKVLFEENPEVIRQLPAEKREKLKQAALSYEPEMRRNVAELRGTASAIKRLCDVFMGMVRKEAPPKVSTYTNLRFSHQAKSAAGLRGNCQSLVLNQTA